MAMFMASARSTATGKLVRQITQIGTFRVQIFSRGYTRTVQDQAPNQTPSLENHSVRKTQIGANVSRKDKISFLITTLNNLKDSKDDVYGALDAWVAWEEKFPIGPLKQALETLEKEQQWHRIIQVNKWMLSKGQGTTMRTYVQLIRALDMDRRPNEAHEIWVKKIGSDLHSVPWQLCNLMISVYYRNNMLQNLVKLFKGLESFDRKPPEKSIVRKVADAYEMLGLPEQKERILEKYKDLLSEKREENLRKLKKREKKAGRKHVSGSVGLCQAMDGEQTSQG